MKISEVLFWTLLYPIFGIIAIAIFILGIRFIVVPLAKIVGL